LFLSNEYLVGGKVLVAKWRGRNIQEALPLHQMISGNVPVGSPGNVELDSEEAAAATLVLDSNTIAGY
jgi:hypothetical protein